MTPVEAAIWVAIFFMGMMCAFMVKWYRANNALLELRKRYTEPPPLIIDTPKTNIPIPPANPKRFDSIGLSGEAIPTSESISIPLSKDTTTTISNLMSLPVIDRIIKWIVR